MFNFFKKKNDPKKDARKDFDVELTASVLAYEIARIDGNIGHDELKILMNQLVIVAKKSNKKESEILKIVENYSRDSVSFYDFIKDINIEYSKIEKISLLKFLWDVAYADSKLDIEEERLIRRIADLINIKDIEVLKTKNDAKK